ncbi:hypothetical protein [Nocardia uniformis]|nr:hypothetical protein [Nocardia uniformis]
MSAQAEFSSPSAADRSTVAATGIRPRKTWTSSANTGWRVVIEHLLPEPGQRTRMCCGGHSLGAFMTGPMMAWNFAGHPANSGMRFNWIHSDLAALDPTEAREFVVDAWRMVVPEKLSRAYDLAHPHGPG